MNKLLKIGSVSEGTLRTEDLIPKFLDLLETVDPDEVQSIKDDPANSEIFEWLEDSSFEEPDEANELVSELIDELGEFVPDYCYFGANEGDGADFGVWIDMQAVESDARSGEILKVGAGDEWPDDIDAPYVIEVNDHGNMTLFNSETKKEIWSVV